MCKQDSETLELAIYTKRLRNLQRGSWCCSHSNLSCRKYCSRPSEEVLETRSNIFWSPGVKEHSCINCIFYLLFHVSSEIRTSGWKVFFIVLVEHVARASHRLCSLVKTLLLVQYAKGVEGTPAKNGTIY